jgi:hypothetical protein
MPAIRGDFFPLETPRLWLRPVAPADESALHRLYSDWQIAKWLSRLPSPFTAASAAQHGCGCRRRHGGSPRVGDTYMLERRDWRAP